MPEPPIPEEGFDQEFRSNNMGTGTLSKGSTGRLQDTAFRTRKPNGSLYQDVPSIKYKQLNEPASKVTLKAAAAPPMPTLPKRAHTRSWTATAKERNPLAACLTGPGRAGKFGELLTAKGSRYEGEVLAGRPHGWGKYYVRKGGSLTGDWNLEYEGDWIQGIREGQGLRFYSNGETYEGDFVAGLRHGHGRYTFTNGDVYAGEWVDDQRTGHGTFFYTNGDVYVGNWIKDRKEGRGTLFMMSRQRKYVAEYVAGQPKCGSVLNIEDGDLEPLEGQLQTMSLTSKLDLEATGTLVASLPECGLLQPNKVLAEQMSAVRKARAEGGKAMRMVQEHSGTLSSKDIEMLRHSFILMAGGDQPSNSLLLHQLRELMVMAGLDPAATSTREMVQELLERQEQGADGQAKLTFDNFMKVTIHFQESSTRVQMAGDVVQDADEAGQADDEQWQEAGEDEQVDQGWQDEP